MLFWRLMFTFDAVSQDSNNPGQMKTEKKKQTSKFNFLFNIIEPLMMMLATACNKITKTYALLVKLIDCLQVKQ